MKRNPNNLPGPTTSFIGRTGELVQVRRLLKSTHLLTLTGPGGSGKTRLAIAVASRLLHSSTYQDGVWFVELAGLNDPSLTPQVLASTLHVQESLGRPLIETLQASLRGKKTLLILDNCEHLLPHIVAPIRALLDACPHLHILATSREPLNLADETTWLVPSLRLPIRSEDTDEAWWSRSEAIELFTERARAVLPDFELTETTAPTVVEICRRLDGIPLAIELAAARIKVLDPTQIAARLQDSLHLLARANADAAPRHQTMRAAIDWSYALLAPLEQSLFRQLSVFADGFSLEAAEAVCSNPALDDATDDVQHSIQRADVLDLLSDLVDKSLITVAERKPQQPVRYRLLEPVRQYALERLRETSQEQATRRRHLAYMLEFAEQAEPKLKSSSQMQWLSRLDQEHDNLRAALTWALEDPGDAVSALRLAYAIHLFWQRRGYPNEGRQWLEQAITKYNACPGLRSTDSGRYLARAVVAREWLSVNRGDYTNAKSNLELGLSLAEAADDPATMSHAWGLLSAMSAAGDTSNAFRQIEASTACARRSGDRWTLALADHIRGRVLHRGGDITAARAALQASELLFRETGDKWSIAAVLSAQAGMADDLETARGLQERVLRIYKEFDHREQLIITASNLASLTLLQGNISRAQELFEHVLSESRELGIKATIAFCLRGLGRVYIAQEKYDRAEKFLRESMVLDKENEHHIWYALSLAGLAHIAAEQGRPHSAARALGAIHAHLETRSIHLDTDDMVELAQHDAAIRRSLSSAEFQIALTEGASFTLEQAETELSTGEHAQARTIRLLAVTPEVLQLCGFGPARVLLGSEPVTNWQYARVRELLFYLVSFPSRTKAQIGLALWSEASSSQLRNSLGNALYHLRRALGRPEWVEFEDDQYHFNRTLSYRYDVEEFEANLDQADRVRARAPEQAVQLLEQALIVYQGDLFEDFLQGEWFVLRREELRRKLLDALLTLGQLHLNAQDFNRAADSFRRALEKDTILEEAHRELMRTLARAGERGQALRQYKTLEEAMQAELGAPPGPESIALFDRIKRGESV